ncbi:DUF177 domain-containing protein [Afifella sp. IM 167]|uniref:YceD family protein n=1 Tax=Afifella sp. IM 167 TaxID=2033586 RepID=UPI001CC9FFEE|nr:DUF177 domain-containing protein [Afifella sp. IM 167]MBZ8132504.1 hypothetical protein [Afifella sp. IM 167]
MTRISFSKPLRLAEIPQAGRELHAEASPPELLKIADQLGVPSVESLAAELFIKPMAGDNYRLAGRITGEATRSCVVTLAPVAETIDEEIAVTLRPGRPDEKSGRAEPGERASRRAVEISVDSEEDAEPYFGNEVDIGDLLVQYVALGLDPYPRAEGAAFGERIEDTSERQSPFAALEALKGRRN